MLYFGIIRPYKDVERLIEVFTSPRAPGQRLRIVGSPTPELRERIAELAAPAANVSTRLAFVDDDELVREISRASLVVLPYAEMHNSGAALVALSLDRPILVPRTPSNSALAAEVGPGWVIEYDGELTDAVLTAAQEAVTRSTPPPAPGSRAATGTRSGAGTGTSTARRSRARRGAGRAPDDAPAGAGPPRSWSPRSSLTGCAASPAPAPSTTTANVDVERGITYREVDGEELQLDACLPRADGPHPALVLIHGGAFEVGDRSTMLGVCELARKRGLRGLLGRLPPHPGHLPGSDRRRRGRRGMAARAGAGRAVPARRPAVPPRQLGRRHHRAEHRAPRLAEPVTSVVTLSAAGDLTADAAELGNPAPDLEKVVLAYLGCDSAEDCDIAAAASPRHCRGGAAPDAPRARLGGDHPDRAGGGARGGARGRRRASTSSSSSTANGTVCSC